MTLIMVWPIIAHPPIPPKRPVTMLAMPCPVASRVLSEWVSVRSSTNLAVISDSSRPTSAMVNAYGAMTESVSHVSGTSGKNNVGRLSGSSPSSPTSGTAKPTARVTAVSSTIATCGDGIAEVSRGRPTMIASPAATRG